MSLSEGDLPALYEAADHSSTESQQLFLRLTRGRLFFILAAAVFGLFTWRRGSSPIDWSGFVAALCFVVALVIEVFLYQNKLERTWYEGRATAESVKTLAWRYAIGGEPFPVGVHSELAVSSLFLERLTSLFDVVKDMDLAVPASSEHQISERMRAIRASSLDERKLEYETGRIIDQQKWYQSKADWNRDRAKGWTTAMLYTEALGIAFGIAKIVGFGLGDPLTLSGVVVTAITAWLQTKQHRTLATAYSIAALELASVRSKITNQITESEWAKFVSDAEAAISREHTLWKASRGIRST